MSTENNYKQSLNSFQVLILVITALLGGLVFLRMGYAVGTLGFAGALLVIFTGNLLTFSVALAVSELSSNQKVAGSPEYLIYSRTFGLPIGAVAGTGIFLFQTVSLALIVLVFTETFEPFFSWASPGWQKFWKTESEIPHEFVSVPALFILYSFYSKGKIKTSLKVILGIAFVTVVAILLFLMGETNYSPEPGAGIFSLQKGNLAASYYTVFAVIFPVFTAMTVGFSLFGSVKKASESVTVGTIAAVLISFVFYLLLLWKLTVSVSQDELMTDFFMMRKIMAAGLLVFPLALAANCFLIAFYMLNAAPSTLQAMGTDGVIPFGFMNKRMSKTSTGNKGASASSIFTLVIAILLVLKGTVESLAETVTLLFLVTYGFVALTTFMIQFGANPAYRPAFKSRWYISLVGFLLSVWLLVHIDLMSALWALLAIFVVYLTTLLRFKNSEGFNDLVKGVLFQFNRRLQIYLQKRDKEQQTSKWRPSVICVSKNTFAEGNKTIQLLEWISYKYGFATYIHLIEDYFSKATRENAAKVKEGLISLTGSNSNIYVDTLISPSFTSAIAQSLQLPGISGLPNNSVLLDTAKNSGESIRQLAGNLNLAVTANLDLMVLVWSEQPMNIEKGIHIWINEYPTDTTNLMILLGSIIIGHPKCKVGNVSVFKIISTAETLENKREIQNRIHAGHLPVSDENIEIIENREGASIKEIINNKSAGAGLTLVGFDISEADINPAEAFLGYHNIGNILFVCAQNTIRFD